MQPTASRNGTFAGRNEEMTTQNEIQEQVTRLAYELQEAVKEEFARKYPNLTPESVRIHIRKRWTALDIGSSGAFLVENVTGELYNIKAYGVPDHNKKRKADIGNVANVSGAELLAKRWNPLR